MTICVICENLIRVFTSGYPMRGLFLELIKLRKKDCFKLIFFNKNIHPPYVEYFNLLKAQDNVEIIFQEQSKLLSAIKLMLGFENYLNLMCKADIFIAPSVDYLGKKCHPLINILADLSSIRIPKYSSLKWHGRLMMKRSLFLASRYADHIACISKFTEIDLHNLYPQTMSKTSVLYNGIADEWFDDKYEDISELKFRFNLPEKYWVWWGFVTKRKNLSRMLNAYARLYKISGNLLPSLVLIGYFPKDMLNLKKWILENLKEKVVILDFLDIYKLKTIIKYSEGLIFPSLYEGFGLPIIEAYSQGKPVIHSNITAMPEIAGGLGIQCDPYSVESIETAMMQLLNNADDEGAIKKRKKWASLFTYKNSAQNFSKIIDSLIR